MDLYWTPKDPDESYSDSIDWSQKLGPEETIDTSVFALANDGGLIITSQSNTPTLSTVVLTGGTLGAIAEITCTMATIGGNRFKETVRLLIASSAGARPAPTGYVEPGVADLITRFPAFTQTSPLAILGALTEAAGKVDDTWAEEDFANARLLYAAHILTVDGHGSGPAAQIAGLAGVSRLLSGSMEIWLEGGEKASTLDVTSYGRRYKDLLHQNKAGGFTTGRRFGGL